MSNPTYSVLNRIVWSVALVLLGCAVWLVYSMIRKVGAAATFDAQDSHLRQATFAAQIYAFDYDGYWPKAEDWERTLEPYNYKATRVLDAPIAMNRMLSGQNLSKLTTPEESTVSFFSSILSGPSASGGPADLKRPDPMVSFLDGRARVIPEPRLPELQW